MSDADAFTIRITMNSRNDMEPGTPKVGGWTYHHVQPVRIYYLAASILLRVATRRNCWNTTRTVSVDAIQRCCQYEANRNRVRSFVFDRRWDEDGADDTACGPIAKLCGSPPCGGFPGPNPLQRSDDPLDQAELHCPRSADPVWWNSLKGLGSIVFEAIGIHALPIGPASLTRTRPIYEWNAFAHLLAASIHSADAAGAPRTHHADWRPEADVVWTYLSPAKIVKPIRLGGTMRLLRPGERRTFVDTKDTPIASLVQRGASLLSKSDDYYVHAAP